MFFYSNECQGAVCIESHIPTACPVDIQPQAMEACHSMSVVFPVTASGVVLESLRKIAKVSNAQ